MTTDEPDFSTNAELREPPEREAEPDLEDAVWTELFRQQLLEANFTEQMEAYARSRAWQLGLAYASPDEQFASDLVQQILFDTLDGRLTWRPYRVSLRKHVMDAIKARTSHACERASRIRHCRIDAGVHDALDQVVLAHLEDARAREELAVRARRILAAMRQLAAEVPDVLLVLDAYDDGAFKRDAVMRLTGLSAKRYDAACARMRRMRDQLPADLRGTAWRRS